MVGVDVVFSNRLMKDYLSVFISDTVSLPEHDLPKRRRHLEVD